MKYFLIILIILVSCSISNNSKDASYATQFDKFIKSQKVIKLPFNMELYKNNYNFRKSDKSDFVILHDSTIVSYIGILEDTSKFYAFIAISIADVEVETNRPKLFVFGKNGTLLDKSDVSLNEETTDMPFIFGYTKVYKDLTIMTQDSFINSEAGPEGFTGSSYVNVNSVRMKILNTGKIKQENIIKREINLKTSTKASKDSI